MLQKVKNKILNAIFRSKDVRKGGERQAAVSLDGIAKDHKARYDFVATKIQSKANVIDMACGVGYGSYLMSKNSKCDRIYSVDISQDAINYAKKFYKNSKISFFCDSALTFGKQLQGTFDVGVCLETIEHIKDDESVLKNYYQLLKNDGILYISHPNETVLPYSSAKFPFHVRHYTHKEMVTLLHKTGFTIQETYSQESKHKPNLYLSNEGAYLIYVCKK